MAFGDGTRIGIIGGSLIREKQRLNISRHNA